MAPVVGDVDGGPGRPGRGLLHVGARQGVARLVLLQQWKNKNQNARFIFPSLPLKPSWSLRAAELLPSVRGDNRNSSMDIIKRDKLRWKLMACFQSAIMKRTKAFEILEGG